MKQVSYWISTPGSTKPPSGPLSLDQLIAGVGTGSIPKSATACIVGETSWVPVTSLLPPPPAASGIVHPREDAPPDAKRSSASRSALEDRYKNLRAVSRTLEGYAMVLKGLGLTVLVVSVISWIGGLSKGDHSSTGLAFLGLAAALGLHAFGTVIGAISEAMLAQIDIAVSTWISAENSGRSNG